MLHWDFASRLANFYVPARTVIDRVDNQRQYAFSVGEDGDTDGIEPSEESVETDLEAFGANVDHRERDTRIDQPEASSFGVDDRATVTRSDGGEQRALFADTDDDQQTLSGERAASQCLFDSDSNDDPDDEPAGDSHADAPDDSTTELTTSTTADDETPRALADGGHVEDGADADDNDGSSDDEGEDGDGPDPTFDADAKTVTEAWEGAYISASWGYNQTNVELAQIVEVSDSGKTVLARKTGAERVGHGRTSEQLRPTADQYGDEFRLHVRASYKDDPRFRGSHPLGNDGDMDGPTRRGSFSPWDNDPENSIRQTATNHGH